MTHIAFHAPIALEAARDAPLPPLDSAAPPEGANLPDKSTQVAPQSWPFRAWHACGRGLGWCFGLLSLLLGLAIVASVPVLHLVSLGYLLEVSGRISRSGRLRDGFFGIRKAGRLGGIVLGTWLMILPLRFLSDMAYSARLIDPESGVTMRWQLGLAVATVFLLAHIVTAWCCGGRLRHFFWPLLAPVFFATWCLRRAVSGAVTHSAPRSLLQPYFPALLRDLSAVPPHEVWFPHAILWRRWQQGGVVAQARDAVWNFVVGLQLPYLFWLGLRGFAGATIWLFLPVVMMIGTTRLALDNPQAARGVGALLGFSGAVLLAVVMLYLPFLQAHLAAERRLAAVFAWRAIRQQFRRAPVAFWFALLSTLLFALPLYLLKVEFVPREVLWLPSLVFVVFIFPARVITGWALGRARRRSQPRHWFFCWAARLAAIPVVGVYVFIVYFTQYTSWYGAYSLFEQHALLTPVPF